MVGAAGSGDGSSGLSGATSAAMRTDAPIRDEGAKKAEEYPMEAKMIAADSFMFGLFLKFEVGKNNLL